MEITIDLSEKQINYLKQFAENHYPGAEANLGTDRPLHLVQTEYTEQIYDDGNCGDYVEYVNLNDDLDKTYNTPRDVVIAYGKYSDPDAVPDYDDAYLHGINGKIIHNVNEYFETYSITDEIARYSVIRKYQTVAYFFTRENAKEYIKTQAHNLRNPRVFTVHRGYANDAEYMHFYDLLMKIGLILNATTTSNTQLQKEKEWLDRLTEKERDRNDNSIQM